MTIDQLGGKIDRQPGRMRGGNGLVHRAAEAVDGEGVVIVFDVGRGA